LLVELKQVQGKHGEYVEGYTINGNDIIDIIRDTKLAIKISNAVIENGLNFHRLKSTDIDKEVADEKDPELKNCFKEMKVEGLTEIFFVHSVIRIKFSYIQSFKLKNGRKSSIQATKTVFTKAGDFRDTTFKGNADFSSATFKGWAGFRRATFKGNADFSSATFKGWAGFRRATFKGNADFSSATFKERAVFSSATFKERVVFSSATFNEAGFSSATFNEAGFSGVTFKGSADFSSAMFKVWVYFSNSTFKERAGFHSATFNEASFDSVTFSGKADFRSASFKEGADFRIATFNRLAFFKEASFAKLALYHAQFSSYADFRYASIGQLDFNSSRSPSVVHGRVDFRSSSIVSAHIQDVVFENDVDFSDAHFGDLMAAEGDKNLHNKQDADAINTTTANRSTVFRFVTFEKEARFNRAIFKGNVALENVIFKREASFTDAKFRPASDGEFSLSYLAFSGMDLDWDALPPPDPGSFKPWVRSQSERVLSFVDTETAEKEAKEEAERKKKGLPSMKTKPEQKLEPLSKVFGQLEAAFRVQKKLDDANQAYYFKKLAERHEIYQKNEGGWPWLQAKAAWCFWGLPTGYGTKLWNLIVSVFLLNLLFVLLYYAKAKLERETHPKTGHEFNFRLRVLDFPKQFYAPNGAANERNEKMAQFINALRFSSVVLLKIGYRDTTASGTVMGRDLKYVVWIEWLLGYFVLAAIAVTMSNTVPLINSLITGLF